MRTSSARSWVGNKIKIILWSSGSFYSAYCTLHAAIVLKCYINKVELSGYGWVACLCMLWQHLGMTATRMTIEKIVGKTEFWGGWCGRRPPWTKILVDKQIYGALIEVNRWQYALKNERYTSHGRTPKNTAAPPSQKNTTPYCYCFKITRRSAAFSPARSHSASRSDSAAQSNKREPNNATIRCLRSKAFVCGVSHEATEVSGGARASAPQPRSKHTYSTKSDILKKTVQPLHCDLKTVILLMNKFWAAYNAYRDDMSLSLIAKYSPSNFSLAVRLHIHYIIQSACYFFVSNTGQLKIELRQLANNLKNDLLCCRLLDDITQNIDYGQVVSDARLS